MVAAVLGVAGDALRHVRAGRDSLRGLTNDVYFQIGLVTPPRRQDAILIVEYAVLTRRHVGVSAAIEAARLRFGPS
jgi:multidrug efflux pump subunit AcrB